MKNISSLDWVMLVIIIVAMQNINYAEISFLDGSLITASLVWLALFGVRLVNGK